jgi:hypothetical protein
MNTDISDQDKYQLSKYFPGKYNPRCTYSPSGEMTAAVSTRNGFSLAKLPDLDDISYTLEDMGTRTYTVLMYCPILSHLTVGDSQSVINNSQPSGFFGGQSASTTTELSTNFFFGVSQNGSFGIGSTSYLDMANFYGYDSTSELETFAYAGRLDLNFVIPAANLTGTYYQGVCRLASLFDSDSAFSAPKFTIGDLIRIADKVDVAKPGVIMSSAMVNDYILTHTLKAGGDSFSDVLADENLGSELVSFVVLQSPSRNINTGLNATFNCIGEVHASSAVIPSAKNLLLYRTFDAVWHGREKHLIDFPYQGPVLGGTGLAPPPPKNNSQLSHFLKGLTVDARGTTYTDGLTPLVKMSGPSFEEGSDIQSVCSENELRFINRRTAAI